MKFVGRNCLALGAALEILVASASVAAQPVDPAGEWQYREDAESCRAYREFGTGEDRISLQLRTFGPGSTVEARVASSELPSEPGSVRYVEVMHGGEQLDHEQVGLLGTVNGVPSVTLLLGHRRVSTFFKGLTDRTIYFASSLDASSEVMQLRVVDTGTITLRTGPMQEPLKRLAQCESGLMEKWGWGSSYLANIQSEPDLRNKDSFSDIIMLYPAAPLLNRVGSILQLRLKVGPDGRVKDCVVQSSPFSKLFGSESCKRIRRAARYTPALNLQGDAVESFAQISVTFARYD